MDITTKPKNDFSLRPLKKSTQTILQIPTFTWASKYNMYPTVSMFVVKKVFPFETTWLCEAGFSAMCILKTNHRSRLEVEADLRLCLSKVSPRFQKLTDIKQAQTSP